MCKKKSAVVVLGALGLLGVGIAIGIGFGLAIATDPKTPDSAERPVDRPKVGPEEIPDPVHLQLSDDVRLTLVRVPGLARTYSTDTVITNSQYHVAVKAREAKAPLLGKDVQPEPEAWKNVVWKDGSYPDGQATCAVLFLNEAEADKYCRWLERRFPDYQFDLPGVYRDEPRLFLALKEIQPERSLECSPNLKTAFDPRPSRDGGPELLSKNGRFWHAPRTNELVGSFRDVVERSYDWYYEMGRPEFAKFERIALRYRRFEVSPAGSFETLKFPYLPNTFRVVATLKGNRKAEKN